MKDDSYISDKHMIDHKANLRKDRRDVRRFWVSTILSLIALVVAVVALWVQVNG